MKKLKIKQMPDHISAIRENGKFLCMRSDNAAGPLFLQEVTKDSVGESCTIFKISAFKYADDKLTLKALISFSESCKRISLQADLLDEDTQQVICSLEEKTIENSTDLTYEYDEASMSVNAEWEHPAVILYADWIDSAGAEGEAALFEDDIPFEIEYFHEYPKKELNGYVAFSSGVGIPEWGEKIAEENREAEGRAESENIIISLFRMPDDTRDLDYACLFYKRDGSNNPQVSVPARGVMRIGTSGVKFDKTQSVTAKCAIASPESGGALVVAVGDNGSYETEGNDIILEVSDDRIAYNMMGPWSQTLLDEGGFVNHPFNFQLDITCKVITQNNTTAEYNFCISSILPKGEFCLEHIPQITIKWGCLAEGTEILMADGTQKIVENIRIGDLVKTDGGIVKVTNMWSGKEEECLLVRADNGRELIMTKSHPVLTAEGWKQAGELICGDVLKTESGGAAVCEIERVPKTVTVYNPETGGKIIYANGFAVGDFTLQNSRSEKE